MEEVALVVVVSLGVVCADEISQRSAQAIKYRRPRSHESAMSSVHFH
jgi:hypothetical protein